MKSASIYFDICEFLFTESCRVITINLEGVRINIFEEKLGDSDLWIVLSTQLENVLQKRFLDFYPMFFGVLLKKLHEMDAQIPLRGICLDDIDRAYENNNLQSLAESIAGGTYKLRLS
ncbi:hypothetical protein [Silvimonas soli]|uniref:hypothetical protein n=1 Tax=Silvimonas soli TaxID=2980100 RepID=UPI0024B3400E|nr:hypothetical protein [Silvimonas soli]